MKLPGPMLSLLIVLPTAGGCASLWNEGVTLPARHSLVREQLVVHSDFPLAAQHRLLEDLTARRYDLTRHLGIPLSDEPIDVYLFDDAGRFETFMDSYYPDFPRRRAFFVETDTRLIVYAHWGDRVAEDLRHEVTHGYLHASVPTLPLWLDEGFAEYFEVPRGSQGMNSAHLQHLALRLQQGQWRPDLRRLQQCQSSFSMTQDDYAEAWAWVHFLLHTRPEHQELLRGYLGELRRNGLAEPLSVRLGRALGPPEAALLQHVHRLIATGR